MYKRTYNTATPDPILSYMDQVQIHKILRNPSVIFSLLHLFLPSCLFASRFSKVLINSFAKFSTAAVENVITCAQNDC